ncbi:hypothetical protein E6P97_02030 [Patescibacteria group bacterium]|nr:MAG: hypothetical protein E6P97_02030 [Patescibacteria group bacterium]
MSIFVNKKDAGISEDQGPTENSMENQIRISSEAVKRAETDEDKLVSLLFLAGDYRQNEQYDQAIAQYQQVLNRDSSNIQALGGMVLCYQAKRDAENTIKYAQQALASIESSDDKDTESIEYYQQVIQKTQNGVFPMMQNEESSP